MKFGLDLRNFGDGFQIRDFSSRSPTRPESASWDGVFIWNRVSRPTGAHPLADPVVTLTAIAPRTRRIRLGTLVTPVPRRRPWKLARGLVSLDVISEPFSSWSWVGA
jgi:alkanesulfonate monooxygenase SsuD/methylene tetrahydromethanopterin reductase-like flavin-dependent oxidoreductase (luciferase family)